MSRENLENGETFGVHRGKLNANFTELYSIKLESNQVLTLSNTNPFTPTSPYHPATKAYADALRDAWDAVFNPQSISADIFARANHTGQSPPSSIAEDINDRFVSDVQVSNWDQKEDNIGSKGSAFNKNFGTIAGTVAEGNHLHTKTDIGLGNVDNTSDINKPISTLQQTAIDAKLNKITADFTPQSLAPSHQEGRVFYDSNSHTLNVYNDIADVTLNIGEENYIRIINKSGSTIFNGSVCRHNGVDVTTKLPMIALALADTVINATILGVATHDIPNNTEGFLTTQGKVSDIDYSAFPAGQPMYLSGTIEGGIVAIAPDIISQVGGILHSDVNGSLMVNIRSVIAFPALLGILQEALDTYALSSTYQDIDNYNISDSVGMTVNALTGHLNAPNDGWYRVSINLTATVSTASPGGDSILFRLFNVTQGIASSSTTLIINSANLTGSRSATGLFQANAGDDLVLQMASNDTTADLDFDSIAFDIESVNIR
jgi:hypothetical protein